MNYVAHRWPIKGQLSGIPLLPPPCRPPQGIQFQLKSMKPFGTGMDGLGWLQDNKQNQHFASPACALDTCILNLNSEEAAEKGGFK